MDRFQKQNRAKRNTYLTSMVHLSKATNREHEMEEWCQNEVFLFVFASCCVQQFKLQTSFFCIDRCFMWRYFTTLSSFRQLVFGVSRQRPSSDPRLISVGFMVDKVTPVLKDRIFSENFRLSRQYIPASFPHTFVYLLIYLFIYLFIHSFIHSCMHSLTHSFIYRGQYVNKLKCR
jgi:hypothetical protein